MYQYKWEFIKEEATTTVLNTLYMLTCTTVELTTRTTVHTYMYYSTCLHVLQYMPTCTTVHAYMYNTCSDGHVHKLCIFQKISFCATVLADIMSSVNLRK